MTPCPVCLVDVHPTMEMEMNGTVVESCPKCTTRLPKSTPVEAPPKGTERHDTAKGESTRAQPLDPVAALRSRLVAVEAQIPTAEQLKALRIERRRLRAALRALGAT